MKLKALSKRLSFGTVVNLLVEVALVTQSENQFYYFNSRTQQTLIPKRIHKRHIKLSQTTSKSKGRSQIF